MDNFKALAAKMLEDDEMTEAAVGRSIERATLREQLEECRQLGAGILSISSLKEGKEAMTEKDILRGIRNNSPVAWKALYASFHDSLEKDLSDILK